MPRNPVVIVGAGLAGLACASYLHRAGTPVLVVDAADEVGGRVRTDRLAADGGTYLIDRGFQVYLTAYPEGRRVLDLDALDLRPFAAGARVWCEGRLWPVADPLRAPVAAGRSLLRGSPLLTAKDVATLALMDARLRFAGETGAWKAPEETTESFLHRAGLSDRVIDRLFRPFFGGVFLDRSLRTSARKFRATYRMFARGRAALPARGMQAIPTQLAAALPATSVRAMAAVRQVDAGSVRLDDGATIDASAVVVATDGTTAHGLLPEVVAPAWSATAALSFAADDAPAPDPVLYLDGDGTGPANHVAVISNVAPGYAPPGRALISANVVAPHLHGTSADGLVDAVRQQLREWFGPAVDGWRHLRTDTIDRALPAEDAPALEPPRRPVETSRPGIFVAGDHRDNASINGALESGRRAATRVLAARR